MLSNLAIAAKETNYIMIAGRTTKDERYKITKHSIIIEIEAWLKPSMKALKHLPESISTDFYV